MPPDARPDDDLAIESTFAAKCRYWVTMFAALFSTLYCGVGYTVAERFWPRSGQFARWGARWSRALFLPAGIRVRTTLIEDISQLTPCVFVANHQNSADIPGMLLALPVEFGFVAKASLSRVPVLGHAISASPSVFVEKADPRRSLQSMRTAAVRIREGSSVLVFPEGERSYSRRVKPFKKSAFALAAEAGVPIVPVAIHNAFQLFDERHRLCSPGVLDITTGNSFTIPDASRQEIQKAAVRARDVIRSLLDSRPLASDRDANADLAV